MEEKKQTKRAARKNVQAVKPATTETPVGYTDDVYPYSITKEDINNLMASYKDPFADDIVDMEKVMDRADRAEAEANALNEEVSKIQSGSQSYNSWEEAMEAERKIATEARFNAAKKRLSETIYYRPSSTNFSTNWNDYQKITSDSIKPREHTKKGKLANILMPFDYDKLLSDIEGAGFDVEKFQVAGMNRPGMELVSILIDYIREGITNDTDNVLTREMEMLNKYLKEC
jgi:hypothetical protein